MFKRGFTITGTVLLALGALFAMFIFLSPPERAAQAAPPAGCISINQDITVNTTWDAPCYEIMTSTVTVIPGVVLTIAPPVTGTAVYFQTGARLQVEGNLQALGTPSRPITFTASNPQETSPCGGQGRWLGILFGTNSVRNRIEYALIEYACTGIAPSGSTGPGDGDRILSNTLRYNGGTGEFNGAIGGDIDYSEISYNTIYSCSNGIVLNEGSVNTMAYNVIRDIAGVGIHLKRGGTGGGNTNIIHRNTIYNCAGRGVQTEDSHDNFLTANDIHDCNAEGIRLDNGSGNRASDNVIYRTMLSSTESGGAISVISQTSILLQNNFIYNNGGGSGYRASIYVDRTPDVLNRFLSNVIYDTQANAVQFTAATSSDSINRVWYNAFCSLPAHELRNDASVAIDANHNRWGTPHPDAPTVGVDPLNNNIRGLINTLTTWMTFTVEGDASGLVTVALRDQDGHTVPPALAADRAPTLPAPNARRITLVSNWGTLNPATVVVGDDGRATTTLLQGSSPAPARIIITATDFCNEAVTNTLAIPDLVITKTALTTQTVVGGMVTYRIDYANRGDSAAAGLAIRDTLPVGMQWVADTAVPPWTRGATTPEIVWTLPGLAAGARGSFLVTTTVNSVAACGLQLTNLAVITGTTLEARLDNNASSAAPVTVLCPSIEITKTGPTLSKVGDIVTYTYEIRNTSVPASAPPLDVVSIVDTGVGWPGLGNLTARGCTPLATGAVCTFQASHTVAPGVPDPLVNVVTATYRLTAFNQTVTASDSHSVNLFQPSITFAKTGEPLSKIGDSTTYTLTLDNTSSNDSPDLQCRITDALLGLNQSVTLAWNAAPYVLTRAYTIPAGAPDPLVNTANVACSPIGFPNIITATATHSVNLFQPSITFAKTGEPLSKIGDSTTYTLTLDNTSSNDSPDLQCRITDALLGLDQSVRLAWNAAPYVLTRAYTVPAGAPDPLVNTANVACSPIGFANIITATATHSVNLFQPSITFAKTGEPLSKIGDSTTYTLTLDNTSSNDSPDLQCRITDALLGLDQSVRLAWNAAPYVLTRAYTVPAGAPDPLVNTANVACSPIGFPNIITATATHSVNLFQPSITFAKTGEPLSKIGDSTTYTLTLDNTSSNDSPDLQCRITDALLGLDQSVRLAWNATPYVLTRAYTIPAGAPDPLVNTANVACSPLGFANIITATDNHTVNLFRPAVQVDKSGPAEAHPGDTITYTFRITNTGLPDSPALILDAITDVGVGWPGLGDLTARATANGCASLAAGAGCVFGVPYAIPSNTPNGDWVNTVSVRYHPLGFTNAITDTDAHTITITGAVDIVVIKDDNVGPITNTLLSPVKQIAFDAWRKTAGSVLATAEPYHREFVFDGDLVTYTISVVNVGVMPATNVILTETLPLYTSYVGYGWTLVGGRTYRMNVGTLQPGEGIVRYFVVRVNEPLSANISNLDNLVCGWAAEGDRAPDDNCNHEDTPVLRRPQIEKTFSSTMGVAGQVISFTITYTNPNNVPLTGVRITDTLPPDTVWHSDTATAAGWTRVLTTPDVAWYTPTLGAGVSGSFILNVIYNPAVKVCDIALTNIVTLTVLNNKVAYFADADSETFTIRCPSDLVVIKDDDVGPTTPFATAKQQTIDRLLLREVTTMGITQHREFIYEGDVVTYTIAVENVGPYTATNVILTEILPLYTDYIGYGWTLVSGRTYTMALGTLAPGQGGIYYFVVRAHDIIPEGVNNLINYVCGRSKEPDYHPADNCNYEDTPLRRRPLRISKTAPRCIAPGDYFSYNTFYTNTNATTGFVNVPITDTLSPFITYAGTNWTCVGAICRYTIPTIPAATYNQPGPPLRVQLNPNFTYTADSRIVNTIEISGGYRYILTSTVDLGPDLVVVKNDNIGPLPLAQQAAWDEVTAYLERPVTTQSVAQRLYAQPGELITYTIVYVNSGVGTAHNVVLTERLPNYTRYVGGGWTHSVGPYYTMTIGTLEPGQGRDLVFIVEVVDPFPLGVDRVINEVRITTTDEECDTSNNSSNDDTPIRTDTLLYVANRESDSIDVFRTDNFAHVTSFSTADMPFGMVVVGNQLYVANAGGPAPAPPSRVQVFDLATHSLITNVTTGYGTFYLTALDGYVYATNHDYGGEGITVIEHATHNVVARLKPNMPLVYDWGFFGITADSTRHVVYSTKRYMGAQGVWQVASAPSSLAFTPLDATALTFNLSYFVNTGDNLPYSTIYNRATDHVYVTFPYLNELRVYDPDNFSQWTVFPTQQQAPSPDSTDGGKGMAVMGECVYNANFAAQSVSVLAEGPCSDLSYSVAAQSVIQPQETFLPPGTFFFGFQIYLPTVLRAWQAYPNITHIAVGGRPKGLAAGGGIVFVTLPEQNSVAVLDTRVGSVVAYIPTVGTYPHTAVIVYDAPWLAQ